ncbi:Abi-alpha family protein [Streptococcus sp. FT1-106]|uniref:Abi-alpha family protein n=2 Tax=unclassified Streptococcus TaxID=2608887 RepID=UPI003BCB5C33
MELKEKNMNDPQDEILNNLLTPEIANSILLPTAKEIGKSLHGVSSLLLFPLLSIDSWITPYVEKLSIKTQREVEKIAVENLQEIKSPSLFIKIYQDALFNIENDELCEMFSKLLAANFNKENNDRLIPRFSTILMNMSVNEAIVFQKYIIKENCNILIDDSESEIIKKHELEIDGLVNAGILIYKSSVGVELVGNRYDDEGYYSKNAEVEYSISDKTEYYYELTKLGKELIEILK